MIPDSISLTRKQEIEAAQARWHEQLERSVNGTLALAAAFEHAAEAARTFGEVYTCTVQMAEVDELNRLASLEPRETGSNGEAKAEHH